MITMITRKCSGGGGNRSPRAASFLRSFGYIPLHPSLSLFSNIKSTMRSLSTLLLVVTTLAAVSFTSPVAMDITVLDELPETVEGVADIEAPIVKVVDELAGGSMDIVPRDGVANGLDV
ncbi:hypothetical protein H2248_005504 [Termitomyces sp. 'cryptogamus']|nr:hypothetical protein H2248_005504 [Termitomyces sp. 'cryptogamus']